MPKISNMSNKTDIYANELRDFAANESKADQAAILEIAQLVEDGDLEGAYKAIWGLDTYVRDGIPSVIYDFVDPFST